MTLFRSDALAGKRILVTGGGTGLGKEMSLGFAAHGAHVFICGRREAVLDSAVKQIRAETEARRTMRWSTSAMPQAWTRRSQTSGKVVR
jgi:NAD(P)-dependent dehydrogenase (short-subunit alcohol dehydrogenase family)